MRTRFGKGEELGTEWVTFLTTFRPLECRNDKTHEKKKKTSEYNRNQSRKQRNRKHRNLAYLGVWIGK